MARNKVVFGDEVLLDLTADTVTPETLARGETAHDKAGETIVGTADLLVTEEQSGESLAFDSTMGGVAFTDDRGLRVVGKTAQDSLSGKNLAPQEVEAGFWNSSDGGAQAYDGYCRVPPIVLDADKLGQDITDGLVVSSNLPIVQWILLDADGNAVDKSTSVTNATNDAGYFVWLDIDTGVQLQTLKVTLNGSVDDFEWVQAETSDYEPSAFEPYCGGIPAPNPAYPLPIRCVKADTVVRVQGDGKNLWAYTEFGTSTYAGVTFEAKPDGILANGTSTASISYKSTDITADLTVGVSYVVSVRADNLPSGVYPYFVVTSSSGNKYLTKFTMAADVTKVMLYISISKNTVLDNVLLKPQYEVGTTATAFEPYPMRYDLLAPCDLYEGDTWWPASGRVEKHMGVYVFDGDEAWSKAATYADGTSRYIITGSSGLFDAVRNTGYCDYYRRIPYASISAADMGECYALYGSSGVQVRSYYANVTEFKAALAQHPITIVYARTTPTAEQYARQAYPAMAGAFTVKQIPVEETATLGMTVVTQ